MGHRTRRSEAWVWIPPVRISWLQLRIVAYSGEYNLPSTQIVSGWLILRNRVWDTRKFQSIPIDTLQPGSSKISSAPNLLEIPNDAVETYTASKNGKGLLRAEWRHNKSVSSAYWDPRGRSIVSTSYDDTIRCKWPVRFCWSLWC